MIPKNDQGQGPTRTFIVPIGHPLPMRWRIRLWPLYILYTAQATAHAHALTHNVVWIIENGHQNLTSDSQILWFVVIQYLPYKKCLKFRASPIFRHLLCTWDMPFQTTAREGWPSVVRLKIAEFCGCLLCFNANLICIYLSIYMIYIYHYCMYIHICMYKIIYACQLPAYLILGFICTSTSTWTRPQHLSGWLVEPSFLVTLTVPFGFKYLKV